MTTADGSMRSSAEDAVLVDVYDGLEDAPHISNSQDGSDAPYHARLCRVRSESTSDRCITIVMCTAERSRIPHVTAAIDNILTAALNVRMPCAVLLSPLQDLEDS